MASSSLCSLFTSPFPFQQQRSLAAGPLSVQLRFLRSHLSHSVDAEIQRVWKVEEGSDGDVDVSFIQKKNEITNFEMKDSIVTFDQAQNQMQKKKKKRTMGKWRARLKLNLVLNLKQGKYCFQRHQFVRKIIRKNLSSTRLAAYLIFGTANLHKVIQIQKQVGV